jgi:hypothetical protein
MTEDKVELCSKIIYLKLSDLKECPELGSIGRSRSDN